MPTKPSSKRKPASEDPSSNTHPSKKPKTSSLNNAIPNIKNKPPNSEVRGGLIILRAPSRNSTAPPSESSAASKQKRSAPESSTTPPSPHRRVRQKTDTTKNSPTEEEVASDVRAMDEESNFLRRHSLRPIPETEPETDPAASGSQPFLFSSQPRQSVHHIDVTLPIHQAESPQIARNKKMRDTAMAKYVDQEASSSQDRGRASVGGSGSSGHHRRRSSISRGKRISGSYESTGIIAQPHSSVQNEYLYRHIDRELPEAQKRRQLLIWSWPRTSQPPEPPAAPKTSKTRSSAKNTKDPPHLSAGAVLALKGTRDDVLRMLADKSINVSATAGSSQDPRPFKPNPNNLENAAWKTAHESAVQRMQQEQQVWDDAVPHYSNICARLALDLDAESLSPPSHTLSAKAKGKQRAVDGSPLPSILSHLTRERDKQGLELAQRVLSSSSSSSSVPESSTSSHQQDLAWNIDFLYSLVHSGAQVKNSMETELDRRYGILADSLRARYRDDVSTQRPDAPVDQDRPADNDDEFIGWIVARYLPRISGSGLGINGSFGLNAIPPGGLDIPGNSAAQGRGPVKLDPQELLRALTRVDSQRSADQVSESARRAARELRRAEESGAVLGVVGNERRLTFTEFAGGGYANGTGLGTAGLQTPKKLPGTPRRGSTPGRDRPGTPRARTPGR